MAACVLDPAFSPPWPTSVSQTPHFLDALEVFSFAVPCLHPAGVSGAGPAPM